MTPYLSSLSKSNHVTSSPMIQTVDGSTMHVCHIGTISIPSLSILNVFHVPQLSMNLLSIGHLCKLGFHVCFPPLVMMCRILKRGKLLGNVIELEKCSSFHPFIFLNVLFPLQHHAHHHHPLFNFDTLVLTTHLVSDKFFSV